jgi:hypothetical protein
VSSTDGRLTVLVSRTRPGSETPASGGGEALSRSARPSV